MNLNLFEKLQAEGLISGDSLQKVKAVEDQRLFSLHWELKTLLYLGVLLLSGGLGILVYKNIDTIGHQTILIVIALVSAGCYYYCIRTKRPFSPYKVMAPNPFFDYVLLLGCLAFVTLIGYLQFQYALFGNEYGLATFIPMVVLFISAYFFDHIGILSLAITNLAAWAGISITPLRILKEGNFSDDRLIYTGLGLGVILVLAGLASERRDFKKHFEFTYTNFGIHLLFIASLAGLFQDGPLYLCWFLLLLGIAFYFYRAAMKRSSFYFLLLVMLYGYIAVSYVVLHLLWQVRGADLGPVYAGCLYFILSAIGVVRALIILNRKMKTHDSIQ